MKNDYVQASLQHSRFLFVYSAKHATEMERSGIEVDALLIVVLVSCFQKNNKK